VETAEKPDPNPTPAPRCPFCGAADAEIISLFGSQVMTMQLRCRQCRSYFEASKY
jgi:transcription elongation factor Elf1